MFFLYAGVCVSRRNRSGDAEAVGGVLHGVFLTAMGLPWECYEIWHKFSPYKVGLLGINVVVLGYLCGC